MIFILLNLITIGAKKLEFFWILFHFMKIYHRIVICSVSFFVTTTIDMVNLKTSPIIKSAFHAFTTQKCKHLLTRITILSSFMKSISFLWCHIYPIPFYREVLFNDSMRCSRKE